MHCVGHPIAIAPQGCKSGPPLWAPPLPERFPPLWERCLDSLDPELFQEHYQSVKQVESIPGPTFCRF